MPVSRNPHTKAASESTPMPPTQNNPNPVRDIPHYLHLFHSFAGPRLYLVLVLALLATFSESLGIVMLLPLLQSLDAIGFEEPTGISGVLNNLLSSLGLADSTLAIMLLVGILFLTKAILAFVAAAYKAFIKAELTRNLRSRLYSNYSQMELGYYVSRHTGHFTNVINLQIDRFTSAFDYLISLIMGALRTLVFIFVALVVAWRFGVMTIFISIGLFFSFSRLTSYVRSLSRKTSEEDGRLETLLIQALQNFKYLSATAAQGPLQKAVGRSIKKLQHYSFRKGLANAFTSAVREPLTVIAILAIVVVQIYWLDQPLAPILISILLFHRGLGASLETIATWQRFLSTVGSIEMIRDEFSRQSDHHERDGSYPIGPFHDHVEFRSVSFKYGPELPPVLRGISLSIPAKSTVAFVGESGAGKSTLVDILTLMLKPTQGQLLIDDVPSDEIRLSSWREQIGFVSQETVIFDDTVANNVCLWRGEIDDDAELLARVEEAARRAHIAHVIEGLPNGYHTIVGDRGIRLSGGQRQRLCIARELFKRPRLLILDEATSSLDSESELAIRESIDGLKGEITMVVIAHRLASIRNVDCIHVLHQGRIVESGTYEELRDKSGSRFAGLITAQKL